MSRTHPAFSDLADADRDWLSEESNILDLKEQDNLASHALHNCCVVIHGKLTATRQVDGETHQCELHVGDMFGGNDEIISFPNDASVTANERTLVGCIPMPIYRSFMTAYAPFEDWVRPHIENRCQELQRD